MTRAIWFRQAAIHLVSANLLLCSFASLAEGNCPSGYYPIGGPDVQGCAPIPGSGGSGSPTNPGPHWATRWGAIATDGAASRLGGAEGLSSKRRAQKAAIAACKKNGGTKCRVLHSYYNQCGVLAWGNDLAQAYSAETTERASTGALRVCSEKTANCKVFYSGCSYPEQIR